VIKYLILTGGGNITKISRELQISHSNVKRYLEEMLAAGLVEEVKLGRARYFFPAWRDPRIKILKELIESEK
jgi:predicted transcriptional regulator